jgi:acyl-CoA thioester hydrolase
MPLTHAKAFSVRHYECDARGRLALPSYLRFMQEAAFEASGAAGYDLDRYEDMDRFWLVRQTDVEFLRAQAVYGDQVLVRTWVVDFRRVRSRRAYEFRLANTGTFLARAETDWVFLKRSTGLPTPIPLEMMGAFFPEGPPSQVASRSPFPVARRAPEAAYRHRRQVEWRDVDQAGHVNNAIYGAYLETAVLKALEAAGWPREEFDNQGRSLRLQRLQIEYLRPALLNQELELILWSQEPNAAPWELDCVIQQVAGGALVARARTHWACHDAVSLAPQPLPAEFCSGPAQTRPLNLRGHRVVPYP